VQNFRFRQVSLKECLSTQDQAFRLFSENDHFLGVRTDLQTQGRGRLGRHWLDTGSGNFLASLAFRPRVKAAKVPQLSLLSGLAMFNVLKIFHPDVNFFIKWPNDIMVENSGGQFQKLGGILLELKNSILVVGVGVNVHSVDPSIGNAISLSTLTKVPFKNLDLWLESLALEIFKLESQILQSNGGFADLLQLQLKSAMMPMIGKKGHYFKNPQDLSEKVECVASGINFRNGALQVKVLDSGENLELQSGEFSFSNVGI